MSLFTHATVGSNDLDRARTFYDGVLGALGYSRTTDLAAGSIWGKDGSLEFFVVKPLDGAPASVGNGVTISFRAPSGEAVSAFHAKGLELGGVCAGEPGPRAWNPGTRAAYVRDLDGNKLAAYGPE
jgi:catechol 2,3-dioxygenase-like lactoylglutathione lyase family enzyme